jgi:molybdopterin synthase catalytic subunit
MIARIVVQAARFDLGAEYAAVAAGPEIGGVGCFVGQVRGEGDLVALTLEHYPGMTERALAEIVARAQARWALLGCTVIHRIGRLAVGEPIVLVLTASRHRRDALEATRFLIDWLKTDAPFWKREEHADGGHRWVEGEQGRPGAAPLAFPATPQSTA